MNATATFLVEIGTEELPPKSLEMLARVFSDGLRKAFADAGLKHGVVSNYAAPRRLAASFAELVIAQEDQKIERRGPALAAAFDDKGEPTKAALGFAKSCNTDVASLGRLKTDKGEWLSYTGEVAGKNTTELVPDIVARALANLPIPKPMRWGASDVEFVRPVHWVVLMLGTDVIEANILGLETGRVSFGHRFHAPQAIELASADGYANALNQAHVLADFATRRGRIEQAANDAAAALDCRAIISGELLNEVTALVEWPVAVSGSFDAEFLELPREALIASMQDHQKYFPLETSDGDLSNHFITISNIESLDPGAVKAGNERVIRPRLADAAFFWQQDRKSRLDQNLGRLDDIIFEKSLGSLAAKSRRTQRLVALLAPLFGADTEASDRAAILSRCDLVSEMVGEFPELQGTMGAYYAAHDGENERVCAAIGEFYQPRFAGDEIPSSAEGRCLAFADKLDSIVGIFAIGSAPTGDKDPYALRRAALGCIRIAIESGANVDLAKAIECSAQSYADVIDANAVRSAVLDFLLDRLRGYFSEQKIPTSVIEAVLSVSRERPNDVTKRIHAVVEFSALAEAESLAAANKRIANILKKNASGASMSLNSDLLVDDAERSLAKTMVEVSDSAVPLLASDDFNAYLKLIARLRDPVDKFFDEVMVMSEDPALRDNRLALLTELRSMFTRVADVARLKE